jgi:hypothetical protein
MIKALKLLEERIKQDGRLLTSLYPAVSNYPEEERLEDPQKHPSGPITSKKSKPSPNSPIEKQLTTERMGIMTQ